MRKKVPRRRKIGVVVLAAGAAVGAIVDTTTGTDQDRSSRVTSARASASNAPDPDTATPSDPASVAPLFPPGPVSAAALQSRVTAYSRSRGADVSFLVHDLRNDKTAAVGANTKRETLSIVKVLFLGALLEQHEESGGELTTEERRASDAMIRRSDNDAADTIFEQVGIESIRAFAKKLGMTSTVVREETEIGPNWWGYSVSTAADQGRLIDALVRGTTPLSEDDDQFILDLMGEVEPSQQWGVADGAEPGATVSMKAGWGPRPGGRVQNSIGYVAAPAHSYTLVILSRGDNSPEYGRETATGVSRLVSAALTSPLA